MSSVLDDLQLRNKFVNFEWTLVTLQQQKPLTCSCFDGVGLVILRIINQDTSKPLPHQGFWGFAAGHGSIVSHIWNALTGTKTGSRLHYKLLGPCIHITGTQGRPAFSQGGVTHVSFCKSRP